MQKLNPQQQQAVVHSTGPLLILAGAGTGKTRVVTERMAYMLRQGVRPENLLGVTFTNKAAGEMRERLLRLAGKGVRAKDLLICTFHSLAVRLLRRDAAALGYTRAFSICDYGEQSSLVRKALTTVRGGGALKPDDALRRISGLKNKGVTPDEFRRQAVDDDEMTLASVYRRYQEALRRQNCFDFDDLLSQALALFKIDPDALEYWRLRFHYIMVDEFQDTNAVQFSLVRQLAAPRNNICVVGDDDQSIYAWRGAVAGNILKFNEQFPGTTVVTLEQNYRSTSRILSAANAVIKNNPFRREKNLWSDIGLGRPIRVVRHNDQHEEAEAIAGAIRERRAEAAGRAKWSDFAVIIRANGQARPLEDEFLAGKLPYVIVGGQSLFDRKEARDVLSFLSVVANPGADNELLRIINVPPRGIGGKTVDALTACAARRGGGILRLLSEPESVEDLPKAAAESCREFASRIARWRERLRGGGFAGLVKDILEEVEYKTEITQLYPDPLEAASRWNEALELGDSLETFFRQNEGAPPEEVLLDFLCDAMLAGRPETKKGDDVDAVRIITAHSAKGLEFPYVFVPGLEEEIFPHKNAIEADTVEEERRLFYVAMTRARLELTLLWNCGRIVRGKETKRTPSRFLEEIPGDFLERSDAPTREETNLDWVRKMREKREKRESYSEQN